MHLTVRVLTRTYLILTLSKIKVILCETSSMFLILFRFGVIITGRSSSFGSISFNTLATCFSCWTMLLILSPQTFIMLPWICLTSSLHWSQSLVFDGASVYRLSLSSASVQLLGLSSGDTCTGISGDVSTGHDCLIFDSKFGMDSKISKSRLKWGASRYSAGKKSQSQLG